MGAGKGGKGGNGGGATPLSSARSGKIVIISGSSSSEDGSEDLKAAVIKPKFWDFVRSSKEAAGGGVSRASAETEGQKGEGGGGRSARRGLI